MSIYEEPVMRHRKKSNKKSPKKADHVHNFVHKGKSPDYSFLTRYECDICGKPKDEFEWNRTEKEN